MNIYLKGKRIYVDPAKSIGKGNEADIFDIGSGMVLKLFKPPEHPDYQGLPDEEEGARVRIAEHQEKLPAFPRNMPTHIITPQELATDQGNKKILGYTMKFLNGAEVLLQYADRTFRQAVPSNDVSLIFGGMHATVASTHKSGVVIGDFNDLNVLIRGTEAYFIDADSFQFGRFLCKLFTARFVDPLLCDKQLTAPMLINPHNAGSDWYAFAVMLIQCLLFVSPYGGIYIPKNPAKRIPHDARPLHRITIFHPEVRYPKPAVHYKVLPDDLLQHFHLVFEKDRRGEFPLALIEKLRWTKCTVCGMEHARNVCPECAQAAPAAIKEVTRVRGKVMATRIFSTGGVILYATCPGDKLLWLYHESGKFRRENGTEIASGELEPAMRFRLHGKSTLIGKNSSVVDITPNKPEERLVVDAYGTMPIFDANENYRYWIKNGQLMRDGTFGGFYIGSVLPGQTLFWVGPSFGFGFYRASDISVAFVFDAERQGINDGVKLRIRGQLVDSTAVFTKHRCWFLIAASEGRKVINRCMIILPDGSIEATAEAEQGDGSWLSTLRGKCAAGNFLLAATDGGVVRVEPDNGQIRKTKEFPDTEPFVDGGCHLFPCQEGLYVVSKHEVSMLKIT